jgi:hypothetical protein
MKRYEINFRDPESGALTAIDVVEAPEVYSAEDYLEGCRINSDGSDAEWLERLEENIVVIEL